MKKLLLIGLVIMLSSTIKAQIFVSQMVGDKGKDYDNGLGAFLHFSFPVTEGDDITAEAGFNWYVLKANKEFSTITVPLKLGYRYSFNRRGSGFYVEPQVGYNAYGITPVVNEFTKKLENGNFTAPVAAFNVGYLIDVGSIGQVNIGARYESVFYAGSPIKVAGLYLTLGRKIRQTEE